MATYAIGDIQGCRGEFEALLEAVSFGAGDRLWLLGDLINRGPDSLGTLRLVRDLQRSAHVPANTDQTAEELQNLRQISPQDGSDGPKPTRGEASSPQCEAATPRNGATETDAENTCTIVLGNHDLHFLAMVYGGHQPGRSDTFEEIFAAPDLDELADWLRQQKLMHSSPTLGYVMTHAGIPHVWSLVEAAGYAAEVEKVLRDEDDSVSMGAFFQGMYGDEPARWDPALEGLGRYRLITNYFTRMRLVAGDGTLDFNHKGSLDDLPEGFSPWFEHPSGPRAEKVLFGHWAALDGVTGVDDCVALDTGCVWGRSLTALCLETGKLTSVPAEER